jgi:hypothetical protein
MGLRFDPNNPKDREFLEKRLGKDKLRDLLSSKNAINAISIAHMDKVLQSDLESSSNKTLKDPKYHNIKVWCNTLQRTIHSIWEHELYHMLESLQKRNLISELQHQSHHNLIVEGSKICRLELDYQFIWNGKLIYADAKSEATSPPGFKMKVKLFTALLKEPVYLIERKKLGIYEDIAYGKSKG